MTEAKASSGLFMKLLNGRRRGVGGEPAAGKLPVVKREPSRQAFARLLLDHRQYAEFRLRFSTEMECTPLILFRDGYLRLENLLRTIASGADVTTAPPKVPGEPLSIKRFLEGGHQQSPDPATAEIITIPDWLSTLLLRFQKTFIMEGANEEVKGLSSAARLSVAYGMKNIDENRVRVSVLDQAANEVNEILFTRWYPEFLGFDAGAREGAISEAAELEYVPSADNALIPSHSKGRRGVSLGSEEELRNRRPSRWRAFTLIGKNKSRASSADAAEEVAHNKLLYTRDGFVRMLFHAESYAEFVTFARDTLCLENIMFYESFVRLELQIAESLPAASGVPPADTGLTRCLVRFLENNALSSAYDPENYLVPPSIMNNLILFYSTFIMPGAQHEVNISHALRKGIIKELQQKDEETGIPALVAAEGVPITVFDAAADEILDMLYRNTFHLFLRQREEQREALIKAKKEAEKNTPFVY
ncbi:hypothetical protein DFJ77DRAFT_508675 [Powellomyces hirtus]|nr:hypothetical protein DFJ77DRAFT_508675 [Powellomyces hirtus]